MNVLTATDLAANAALASIAAMQSATGRSEGSGRAMLMADRLDHYRSSGVLTEADVRRRAIEDVQTFYAC